MRDKLTAGVLCWNEEEFIGACIEGALKVAEYVIISDGSMNGTQVDKGQRSDRCEPSSDDTLRIVNYYAEEYPDRIILAHLHGLSIPTEKEVRNFQLAFSSTPYFMIVDSDEIWCEETAGKLHELLEAHPEIDNFYLSNKLFFWNPNMYVLTKHERVYKMRYGDVFVGNNEVTGEGRKYFTDEEVRFHHYGYLLPEKVKRKAELYSSETFYRGVGLWWFEHIYSMYPHRTPEELIRDNFDTLHIWGKIHPGFASHEFGKVYESPIASHPQAIRQLFQKKKFDESRVKYIV